MNDTEKKYQQEAVDRLNEYIVRQSKGKWIIGNGDQELAHIEADKALCKLLVNLGYHDAVEAFENVPKWYT